MPSLPHQYAGSPDADAGPSVIDDETVEDELRMEFDLSETLADEEAEAIVDRALDALTTGDVETAEAELSAFTTPCEAEEPEATDHGNGHLSACLRNKPDTEHDAPLADH